MSAQVRIEVDGRTLRVPGGTTVAAALLNAGVSAFRTSPSGEARGPVCGMGTCFECRVTIDGIGQQRACLRSVRDGMTVATRG